MSDELFNLTKKQVKWVRRVLFGLIILSCFFVVESAWIDLYNPGSEVARTYYDYAGYTIVLMIVLAIPLWSIKIKQINEWKANINQIDDPVLRNKMWWLNLKPIIINVLFVVLMAIIAYFTINYYFHVPNDVLTNYTDYYNSSNSFKYANISQNP